MRVGWRLPQAESNHCNYCRMNTTTYNAAHFIAKFEAIPDEKWCTQEYYNGNASCALGHCGIIRDENGDHETAEATCLRGLMFSYLERAGRNERDISIPRVNDGLTSEYKQETPKGRIMAFLKDAQEAGL